MQISSTTRLIAAAAVAASVAKGVKSVDAAHSAAQAASATKPHALSAADNQAFSLRFRKDIWPLLNQSDASCVGCHNAGNPSQLHFLPNPDGSFQMLLRKRFLDSESPTSLLARVSTFQQDHRMPPTPMPAWNDKQVATLRAFMNDLFRKMGGGPSGLDQRFPADLLTAYKGKPIPDDGDNSFITYYQLRGKIKSIFGDDWNRNGLDQFQQNLVLFNGADFHTRYDESDKPSATFLAGLDLLGQDVASRAYLTASGPFAGRKDLPSPLRLAAPDAAYRAQISRLFQRMLFRSPTEQEMRASFALLKGVYGSGPVLAAQDHDLNFDLIVRNADGDATTKNFTIHVKNEPHGLYEELVDEAAPPTEQTADAAAPDPPKPAGASAATAGERKPVATRTVVHGAGRPPLSRAAYRKPATAAVVAAPAAAKPPATLAAHHGTRHAPGMLKRLDALFARLFGPGRARAKPGRRGRHGPVRVANQKTVEQVLNAQFTFKAGDRGQWVKLSNANTEGDVSVAGVKIQGPLPNGPTKLVTVSDPGVQVDGAWKPQTFGGITSYEDGNENKGSSRLAFPIQAPVDGKYRVSLLWRSAEGKDLAPDVPVEVLSHDPSRLAAVPAPPIPPRGEAHFTIDETVDSIAFWDLQTAFQFGRPSDGVEITNAGTKKRVVADAVQFAPPSGPPITVISDEADGHEKWPEFKLGGFSPFNVTGPHLLEDGNANKGKMTLVYRPSTHPKEWNPATRYRVLVGFPGQVNNETQTPIIVHAQASSPIIQLSTPTDARVGASVTLDASHTYDVQHSALTYTWRQTGGPRVALANTHAARLTFVAPALTPQQAAWEALCRALMKHPDFLFTRPPSLAVAKTARSRRALQLVKIAQDLVGRTPTDAEMARLNAGASLASLVDGYLNSQEFKDFYFHRIRLYLESHGSVQDDEPVRLWCYIAFHNLPFKQILTADYTVDPDFKREPRPAYYGHTGLLAMKGFVDGKPGLPHFTYAAQVAEKFLGYVFQVPAAVVAMRNGITASSTTNPSSICYNCHKLLTPLAYQRTSWSDDGQYRAHDDTCMPVDDTDHDLVPSYPFRGKGMQAFALGAQNEERFIRTMIQVHFVFYFGREMRYDQDERVLYKRLWDTVHKQNFSIKGLIRALVLSPEYLTGHPAPAPALSAPAMRRLTAFLQR